MGSMYNMLFGENPLSPTSPGLQGHTFIVLMEEVGNVVGKK